MKERTGADSAKQRLLFTLAAVTVYRAGLHVSLPGVNRQALQESLSHYSPSLAQTYNEVTGGALSTAAVFSLGITPYIVASILVLLMSGAVLRLRRIRDKRAGADPAFDRLIYGVVALVAALQAWGMAVFLETMQSPSGLPVVSDPGLGFRILAVVSMAAGALLLAWIADQISWKGIANGVAVLVLVDMAASLWQPSLRELDLLLIGHRLLWQWVVLFGFAAGLLALSFAVISAKRYLPLTYVGTAPTTAPQAWTPRVTLRANTVGILPIWLAATLLYVLTGTGSLAWGSAAYWVLHCALIVVFAYVWTAVTFKSSDLVSQLARYGFAYMRYCWPV